MLDGKEAVGIGIFQAPGSNALQLSSTVRATMDELKQNFPQGVEYRIVYDPTVNVRDGIREVVKTLFEAILLVVLVVVLFLQTWRASIIPLVAVPVSIVGTFAILLAFGFSINTLSLFGLVLAIGIVVDDAIVVVENVERNIEAGLSPRDATHKAMDEVSRPIVAISLVLCAVFVPVAFVSGLTGQFYRQFALTIAFSTVISAINSLTLSPALSAILLQPRDAPPDRLTRWLDRGLGWLFRPFNRVFARGSASYGSAVNRVTRKSGIALVVYAGLLALTVGRLQQSAERVRADPGQAVPGRLCPAPRRGDARSHREGHPPDGRDREPAAGRRERRAVPRSLDQRLRERPERGHHLLHPEAVRRAARAGRVRFEHRRRAQCQVCRHPGGLRGRLPAAAGHRPRSGGRLQAAAGGPRRPG